PVAPTAAVGRQCQRRVVGGIGIEGAGMGFNNHGQLAGAIRAARRLACKTGNRHDRRVRTAGITQMTETTAPAAATGTMRKLLGWLPLLALVLALAAVVLLGLGPLGWRAGWWHFRV